MSLVAPSTRHKKRKGERGKRKSIEQIRTNIYTYCKRREEFKAKYKHIFATPIRKRRPRDQENITKILNNINDKLLILRKSLVLYQRKYNKIAAFDKTFTEYSGNNIAFWMRQRIKRGKGLEKLIIYKYLLEDGVDSRTIVEYTGINFSIQNITLGRKEFNKSFKTKPANLAAWRKFKEYMDNNKIKVK